MTLKFHQRVTVINKSEFGVGTVLGGTIEPGTVLVRFTVSRQLIESGALAWPSCVTPKASRTGLWILKETELSPHNVGGCDEKNQNQAPSKNRHQRRSATRQR